MIHDAFRRSVQLAIVARICGRATAVTINSRPARKTPTPRTVRSKYEVRRDIWLSVRALGGRCLDRRPSARCGGVTEAAGTAARCGARCGGALRRRVASLTTSLTGPRPGLPGSPSSSSCSGLLGPTIRSTPRATVGQTREAAMPGRVRISRTLPSLALRLSLVIGGSGASSSSTANGGGGSNCEQWCGNGPARLTVGGVTATITGGGCYDTGAAGIEARFGDWGNTGVADYLTVSGYRVGGPTPTPAPTTNPLASPTATGHPDIAVDGSIAGQNLVLDTTAIVTFAPDGTGSFSGTDLNGAGKVTGTFSCS